ncbi:MAG: DNA repair protein RecO [Prevotella sp.]|nr:DNA repair protein RecO [Prevotella sp.]
MQTKTDAIVLHTIKYGEQKLIVDMFTRELGRQSFVVPISKSGRSKLKKQYFQPLTLLTVEADVRQPSNLQKLRDATLLQPLTSMLTEPSKLAIGLFIAEFLCHALRDEQRNEQLFDYVRLSIEWLEGRQADYANFHLVFLMHLSRFLGFFPNLAGAGEKALCFDLRAGVFCATPPPHHEWLAPHEARRIRLMMGMDYPSMHHLRLSRTVRNRTLEIIETYYRLHLPAFPELRSLPVLRELFSV